MAARPPPDNAAGIQALGDGPTIPRLLPEVALSSPAPSGGRRPADGSGVHAFTFPPQAPRVLTGSVRKAGSDHQDVGAVTDIQMRRQENRRNGGQMGSNPRVCCNAAALRSCVHAAGTPGNSRAGTRLKAVVSVESCSANRD